MSARSWRTAVALGLAGVVALSASPAWAVPLTEVAQGDVLRLESVADWDAASSMLPNQPVQWDVTVSAAAPEPGVLRVGISADGDAPLIADVQFCPVAWTLTGCPSGATSLRSAWQLPRDGVEKLLLKVPDTQIVYLRLRLALEAAGRGSTRVRVHAHAAGEEAIVGSDGPLAATGVSPLTPWMLAAGVTLTGVGLGLAMLFRKRIENTGGGRR